jgi:hypothetical protein
MTWIANGEAGSSVRTKLNTIPNDGTTALVPQVISRQTPTGVNRVTFSSIPGTYRDLQIILLGAVSGAVTQDTIVLQMNNDSAANYDMDELVFRVEGESPRYLAASGVLKTAADMYCPIVAKPVAA